MLPRARRRRRRRDLRAIGTAPDFSQFDLATHASVQALAMAGLRPRDVDVCSSSSWRDALDVTSQSTWGPPRYGQQPHWWLFVPDPGVRSATARGWQCYLALIAYGRHQRSSAGKLISPRPLALGNTLSPLRTNLSYAMAAAPPPPPPPPAYASVRDDKEHLGKLPFAARKWAQAHPQANRCARIGH